MKRKSGAGARLPTLPVMRPSLLVAMFLATASCGRVLTLDDGGARTCASVGGTCGAVSACNRGVGYLTASDDCAGASSVCCLPLSACNDAPEFDCCSATATFRPTCEGGALACLPGTTRCSADAGTPDAGTTDAGLPDAGPPSTCRSVVGTCGAVSACNAGAGYLTSSDDCTGASSVCCLPLSACQSQPEFDCCANNGRFRPSCDNGQLHCSIGTRCDAVLPDGGAVAACVAACGVGCSAPGQLCYSDGQDYCSPCVANCYGAQSVSCGG